MRAGLTIGIAVILGLAPAAADGPAEIWVAPASVELRWDWTSRAWTEAGVIASNRSSSWLLAQAESGAGLAEATAGWIPPGGTASFRVRALVTPTGSGSRQDEIIWRFEARELLGDVDGDGGVTILDVIDVIAAFGTTSGAADLDASGLVDVVDVVAILGQFGAGTGIRA